MRIPGKLAPVVALAVATLAAVLVAGSLSSAHARQRWRGHQRAGRQQVQRTVPRSFAPVPPRGARALLRAHDNAPSLLDYRQARAALFGVVDNHAGFVSDIYTGRRVATQGIPDTEGATRMNTEHVVPQSVLRAAGRGYARTDLHNLMPSDTEANSVRGHLPFGEVTHVDWQRGGSRSGRDAGGTWVFEPPPGVRGDIARAIFYVSHQHGVRVNDREEAVLRRWHAADPPDAAERARNDRILRFQRNRNPFVDDPATVTQVADF